MIPETDFSWDNCFQMHCTDGRWLKNVKCKCVPQADLREAFAAWAVHNNKFYSPGSAEFESRLATWTENFQRAAGTGVETVTLNGLQDVSLGEFKSSFFGTKERPQTLE
jgi:hypothetical protein